MNVDDWDTLDEWEDYDVTCARCGLKLKASEAVAEEGDEWECVPCNIEHDAKERAVLERGTVP